MRSNQAGGAPAFDSFGHPVLSRRTVLRGAAVGAGVVTLPALLAACGDDKADTGTVTLGSNFSSEVPRKALAEVGKLYEQKSGKKLKINTTEHTQFQERINSYLQAKPDDVFAWFAGYRMQFFARKGFCSDISDLWKDFTGFNAALKAQSTGEDGKQYFVPFYYYPWGLLFRKSLFQQRGYTAPKNFDQLKALAAKMKADGLIPFTFADKEGWPAMGWFDYLNLRSNGYEYHVRLMAGKEAWTDPKVKQVFERWRELLPFTQPGALGRTWEEAGQAMLKKECGMAVFGTPHLGTVFPKDQQDDIEIVDFPEIDPAYGTDTIEAPIDGWLVAKKGKNQDGARDFMKFLASAEAEDTYLKSDPNNVGVHEKNDTTAYTNLQKRSIELVSKAKNISQYLDRDTRPDFASTVMIPAIQKFIGEPGDIDGLLRSIESQKKTIFAAEG